jgi:hypothetical protein
VLAASLLAATLSWWLVERPTRNSARISMRALLVGFGLMLAALIAVGAAVLAAQGLPGRFSPQANRLAAYMDYDFDRSMRIGQCLLAERTPVSEFDRTACLPAVPGKPSYLVIGDSHAGALSRGMIDAYADVNVLQVTASGCIPMLEPPPRAPAKACDALMRFGMLELPRQRRIDGVWLFGRFGAGDFEKRMQGLMATAELLRRQGLPVTIIGPSPEFRIGLPRLLARAALRGEPGFPNRFLAPEPIRADARLKAEARARGLRYVSLIDRLCDEKGCVLEAAHDVPMLFDTDHFTAEGGELVARRIRHELIDTDH